MFAICKKFISQLTGKYTNCSSQAMLCQCCDGNVSTMTAEGVIPVGGSLLLGVEEYTAIQLSPSYSTYLDAAFNESEVAYIPEAEDVCCPRMVVHATSPIRCNHTPLWNNLVADTVALSYECIPASEVAETVFDWRGSCIEGQFEHKVLVGPCAVYPDEEAVPDSYKRSYSEALNYPTIQCRQAYTETLADTFGGVSYDPYVFCGTLLTNSCDTFTTVYYYCNDSCNVTAPHGDFAQLAENAATQCQGYNCEGTPYVMNDFYQGWVFAITRCMDCQDYSTDIQTYSMLAEQRAECYECGDPCRYLCSYERESCYEWLENCESWGGCPPECPDDCANLPEE